MTETRREILIKCCPFKPDLAIYFGGCAVLDTNFEDMKARPYSYNFKEA